VTELAALTSRRGPLLIVKINRPHKHNAVNLEVTQIIGEALEEAEADLDVRAVVLTGAGDKTFCAGADVEVIRSGGSFFPPGREHGGFAGVGRQRLSVPLIAAVNGAAFGGGVEVLLACDIVVAAQHARFGLTEVKLGLFAAGGGAFRLGRLLPHHRAMELLLTGRSFGADEALAWGLVNEIVPSGVCLPRAIEIAQLIAANGPLGVRASKRLAMRQLALAEESDWEASAKEWELVVRSEDAREGTSALVDKRKPQFQGR
jgi:crotonobetainyl-CoA hydratase